MSVVAPSRIGCALGFVCAGSLIAFPVRAQDPESVANPLALEVHGFVSQGFIKTTNNNYLAESERGSLEFAEAGINFTKTLTDELRVGIQLFARDLGPIGDYKPQLDWFYLDYRFRDWFGIRAGRTKLPFGLYNESSDIDAARVPILLPQSMYPVNNRDFLLAQTGVELYGRTPHTGAGALEYRAYGGTIFVEPVREAGPGISLTKFSVPYVVGGRLMWSTPLEGLQLGASSQFLRFDATYQFAPETAAVLEALGLVPVGAPNPMDVAFRVRLHVGSIEYAAHDLLLAAEYGRWIGEFDSAAPAVFPTHTENERYYVMAAYQLAPWFTPSIYYSVLYPDVKKRHGRQQHQHDLALSFRYDFTDNWLFKVETHYMSGTAALDSGLNDGKELKALIETWGVLLLKTTAYF